MVGDRIIFFLHGWNLTSVLIVITHVRYMYFFILQLVVQNANRNGL